MNTVNRAAFANLKQNKGKNILIGFAVVLTTMLLLAILTIGFGSLDMENAYIKETYPNFHAMYRGVDMDTAKELEKRQDVESVGLRIDPGEVVVPDGMGVMVYMDETALKTTKPKMESGSLPKSGHEITAAKAMLTILGIHAEIGDTITLPYQLYEDGGLGYESQAEFTITGFLRSSADNPDNDFAVYVSRDFMEEVVPEEARKYRALMKLKDADSMTTDQIEKRCKEIGEDFGIAQGSIRINDQYLRANYVDSGFYGTMGMVVLVVILAGVITIYSIYYISLLYKVQEYGKLKALGATKRQIRQIVFREGMLISAIAIPAGLLLGSVVSVAAFRFLSIEMNPNEELARIAAQLLENHEVSLFKVWPYLVAAFVSLFTTVLSLLHPMKIAAKISPVEAMRYDGSLKTKRKQRKGHEELNVPRLAMANLSRNRKRTAITIITLGMTGILYVVISTVLASANPEDTVRNTVLEDFVVGLDVKDDDKMNPEQSWEALCKNNPLDSQVEKQITSIPGVKEIIKMGRVDVELPEYSMDGEAWGTGITGIPEEYASILEESVIRGDCTYEELKSGDKIVLNDVFFHWFPEWDGLGENIKIRFYNGSKWVEKEFEVAAVAHMPAGLSRYNSFVLPQSVVEEICDYDMVDIWWVAADSGSLKEVGEQLKSLVESSKYLAMESFQEELAFQKEQMNLFNAMAYVFLAVLGGVGIMNLINTMVNSIYVRRREIGIMQALGLSNRQMKNMLQIEGMFYTAGMFVLSAGIGIPLGYLLYQYAKDNYLMGIVRFHFPGVQMLALAGIVIFLQVIISVIISGSFRKQSMIDRIRYSE